VVADVDPAAGFRDFTLWGSLVIREAGNIDCRPAHQSSAAAAEPSIRREDARRIADKGVQSPVF